jgi:hypothetical protein
LGNGTLRLVDLKLETLRQEPFDAFHHAFACPLTAHVDVAVIGIAYKAMASLLQFAIEHVQHEIRQQG